MDFPIDPALLAEEQEMADAEGEIDGEFEVEDLPVDYPYSEIAVASPRRGRPPKQPVASSSRHPIPLDYTPQPRKKPGPKPKSQRSNSNSAISKTKLNLLNGLNGNGHGHSSLPEMARTLSTETTYVQIPDKPDKHCSFCRGTKKNNKLGEPEKMVSCSQCRQSGHPSCLEMFGRLAKTVFTYDWICINCKVCEVCTTKGNDDDMMFCDGCDRGYHYYCCDPPLPGVPKGKFLCVPCRKAVEARRLQKASFSLPNVRHPPDPTIKYHPPPHTETPTAPKRRGRPPGSVNASRSSQVIQHEDTGDDLFTARPRIKIKGRDKGKGRQVDESPGGFVVKIRVPSGGRSKTVDIEDEEDKVPYGGVITGEDADVSKTTITDTDKERFEKSFKAAESRLGGPPPILADYDPHLSTRGSPAPSSVNGYTPRGSTPNLSKSTSTPMLARGLRDRILHQTISGTPATPSTSTPNGHASGSKNGAVASSSEKIKTIRFGPFDIDTWYSAPYPEEYQNVPDGRLWLCEFCLKYMKSGFVAGRHRTKCKTRHPPGDEIYRDGNISVFEVDGRKNKIYCQNLCLLAKMFLDHKTLYYDVEPFLFYVMTEVDELGARFVGYFSKEKRSIDNNVSCIMTLPVRQRKGWGQLLIDFSYALSKKEGRVGSPEKPLSGLGEVTYKRYWKIKVFEHLRSAPDTVTMDDISATTSLTLDDIYSTLVAEDMIISLDSPPPVYTTYTPSRGRGRRGRGRGSASASAQRRSSHRDRDRDDSHASDGPEKPTIPRRYAIRFDRSYIAAVLDQYESKGHLTLNFDRLKYHPFLVSRDPVKPPGTIAKATLMSNQLDQDQDQDQDEDQHLEDQILGLVPKAHANADGVEAEPEEIINQGEDKATLDLVAKLAVSSPARSLRKRPASTSAPNSAESNHKRPRRARTGSSVLGTPRRSTRGGVDSPLRKMNGNGTGDGVEEDGEWEVEDLDVDAEGEEYVEE